MICFHTSVTANHHHHRASMAKPVISTDPHSKPSQTTRKGTRKSPTCEEPRSAIIDVFILIAAAAASAFLLYPYAAALSRNSLDLAAEVAAVLAEEFRRAPHVFLCLGLSILFAVTALVAITVFADRRCGKAGCRGLRKAAEFDIQLETEDSVGKSGFGPDGGASRKGLFELPRDHHRELEAELKKMAPVNGRAVLVFRARCGCSVGRMEVPGPRKSRKFKK